MNNLIDAQISFIPLLNDQWMIAIGACLAFLCLLLIWRRPETGFYRFLALGAIYLVLLNPVLLEQDKERLQDIVMIGIDQSPSNNIAGRSEQTVKLVEALKEKINNLGSFDIKEIAISNDEAEKTTLLDQWQTAMQNTPVDRIAASFLISDGLIHEKSYPDSLFSNKGPFNVLLTGTDDEKDRVIHIEKAPSYGLVDQEIEIALRIEDQGQTFSTTTPLSVYAGDREIKQTTAKIGETTVLSLPIKHAGDNIFVVQTPTLDGELTGLNNKHIISVKGVRDRLKVLLVSGLPHNGARVWRNLLKSDPNIDLIHFTILRTPDKLNFVPVNELALIPFPVQELFVDKINDFDLIIFDRFSKFGMMPLEYIDNIADYVENGGAFLDVAGPDENASINFQTKLDRLMPLKLRNEAIEQAFSPHISDIGKRHPVTAPLADNVTGLGTWYRQMMIENIQDPSAERLMSGLNDMPLLVIDEVGEGRLAQMASDQIWIWARDNEHSGLHESLMRRLAHWLMKEPELEANRIEADVTGRNVDIRLYDTKTGPQALRITTPDLEQELIEATINDQGVSKISFKADNFGVYTLKAREAQKSIIVGPFDHLEFRTLVRSKEPLSPLVDKTDGRIITGETFLRVSDVKRAPQTRLAYIDQNDFAILDEPSYKVTATRQSPMLPPWLALAFSTFFVILSWYREIA